jgi:hypothetical protein
LQFVPRFRESNWNHHRLLGWIYCAAVALGWCASLRIAPHAQTGRIASAGFLALGAGWIVATGLAVRFILRGDAIRHRRWMIRSFALTAAAITLRIYLPLIFVFHWNFSLLTRPSRGFVGSPTRLALRYTCASCPRRQA